MIVKCEKCNTAFNLDNRIVKPEAKVRCSKCRHVFKVHPHASEKPVEKPVKKHMGTDLKPKKKKPVPESPPQKLKTKDPGKTGKKRKYTPFKTKLIYFAAILISFIGIIVIPIEVSQPWQELFQLIDNSENLISGIESAFDPAELERMNNFALGTIQGDGYIIIQDDNDRKNFFLSFNMLLTEGKILPKEQLEKMAIPGFEGFRLTEQSLDILADEGIPEDITDKLKDLVIEDGTSKELANVLKETLENDQVDYKSLILKHAEFEKRLDYEKLHETQFYWKMRFASDPGIFEIFQKYKRVLMKAYKNAADTGFDIIGGIIIMVDTGEKKGFFENRIAYLLDGFDWREEEGAYVGEEYQIEDNEFWRRLALDGKEGYGKNPVFYRENWFLPRFDEDEYGAWFSVWLTKKRGNIFNVFNIDFNAKKIKDLMKTVGAIVLSIIIFLVIMVALIARWLSKLVTRPITELTKGAEEVALGNYDYQVPILKQDEFGELTEQFNNMTIGQKERLNLMETLEKFLSKELAEMAAEKGIMLGGHTSDCTVMFTDFAGFSTITQKMTAYESVEILNLYFDAMIPIIKCNGGFPDKYIGDAIVALFGAPVAVEDHAERAVSCAIKMQQKMREINDKRRKQVCFRITDDALVYLQAKGVSNVFVEKLEAIRKQTLLEYLKFQGVSDGIIGKLVNIKEKEYIGKGEFLKGEFLDIVLDEICYGENVSKYKSLILEYAEKQKRAVFEMRVGLNSGEVIAGAIGCDAKLEYTSIGETTNLANRMEASCDVGHIAIAEETYMRIRHIFFKKVNISATPDIVTVKGMGDVPVYRVYVNNFKITKDMNMKDNIKKFYVYEEVGNELRESPDDVPGVTFTSIAKYL
ncbi:MAG: HAMP domain-containing protein [Desulfobacterales bacterium]|nr:HAMP domain-containing protein [Desulfobacterales bacterium]